MLGTSGFNCASCGAWVNWGNTHFCNLTQPANQPVTYYTITNVNADEIAKELKGIREALEKIIAKLE